MGTPTAPIVFTSESTPASAGLWCGIYLNRYSGSSTISYATVEGGGYDMGAPWKCLGEGGVAVLGGTPTLSHTTFRANRQGVKVRLTGDPAVTNCVFTGNDTGIVNARSDQFAVKAVLNYWSAADGPNLGSGSGSGQTASGYLLYDPWLTAAPADPEFLTTATHTNRRFNPTGYAHQLAAAGALSGDWTMAIKNGQGTTVRTLSQSGASATFSWDGRDGGGALQPDGMYTYSLDLTATGGTATPAAGRLFKDGSYAFGITAPASSETVSNFYLDGGTVYAVTGSAAMAHLTSWKVELGAGTAPSSFSLLSTSSGGVTNGTLHNWGITSWGNGPYILRLTAQDTDYNVFQQAVPVTVGNFSASRNVLEANTGSGQTVTYTSIVPVPLTETLVLKNASGSTVRTLVNSQRTAGTYADVWNGNTDGGGMAPDGPYFYFASLTDGTHSMVWDRTNQYPASPFFWWNDLLSFSTYDPFANQPLTFTYNFGSPCRETVAYGAAHPVVGCSAPNFCQVTEYHESGPRTIRWAGVDSTGAYRPDIKSIGVVCGNATFSENAAILYGSRPTITNFRMTPAFVGASSQNAEFTLTTRGNENVTVALTYRNQSSLSVLRTITRTNQAPGAVSIAWDGRADNGDPVAAGGYTVTCTVTNTRGDVVTAQALTTVAY